MLTLPPALPPRCFTIFSASSRFILDIVPVKTKTFPTNSAEFAAASLLVGATPAAANRSSVCRFSGSAKKSTTLSAVTPPMSWTFAISFGGRVRKPLQAAEMLRENFGRVFANVPDSQRVNQIQQGTGFGFFDVVQNFSREFFAHALQG